MDFDTDPRIKQYRRCLGDAGMIGPVIRNMLHNDLNQVVTRHPVEAAASGPAVRLPFRSTVVIYDL
jgi:hypothetical protein